MSYFYPYLGEMIQFDFFFFFLDLTPQLGVKVQLGKKTVEAIALSNGNETKMPCISVMIGCPPQSFFDTMTG